MVTSKFKHQPTLHWALIDKRSAVSPHERIAEMQIQVAELKISQET